MTGAAAWKTQNRTPRTGPLQNHTFLQIDVLKWPMCNVVRMKNRVSMR